MLVNRLVSGLSGNGLDSLPWPPYLDLLEKIRDYAYMELPAPDETMIRELYEIILHLAPDDVPSK